MMLHVDCFKWLKKNYSTKSFANKPTFNRCIHYEQPTRVSSTHASAIINSRHDWTVVYNYARYLSTDKSEITRRKCMALLIGMAQMIMEQNHLKGYERCPSSSFLYYNGHIVKSPDIISRISAGYAIEPSSMVRYLKYMAKIRPYYRIKSSYKNVTSLKAPMLPTPPSIQTNDERNGYSDVFARLIGDDTTDVLRPINLQSRDSHIGPLRMDSNRLVTVPRYLTTPFYFQVPLTGGSHDGEETSDVHDSDTLKVIDRTVQNLIQHLLQFFQGHDATNHLCIVAMFLATMIYGPKLRIDTNNNINKAYCNFHRKATTQALQSKRSPSCRSLAYLLNSALYPMDVRELADFTAQHIINAKYDIPLDYLENICYALSKARYKNDDLYDHIATMVAAQIDNVSLTVCINILWSFSRVDKVHMVAETLGRKLATFQEVHFEELNPTFLKRSYSTLKLHLADEVLTVLKTHIDVH